LKPMAYRLNWLVETLRSKIRHVWFFIAPIWKLL
jgi:hypothetical protein